MTPSPNRRSEALRDLGLAVGFGMLSWALCYIRFDIPGLQGQVADLREVGLLLAALQLRRPWGILLVAVFTTISHPAGSFLDGFLVHATAGFFAWAGAGVIRRRLTQAVALGVAWGAFVVLGYYGLVMVPMILLAAALGGQQPWSQLPGLYFSVFRSISFEVVATAALTSLVFVNMRHLLLLKHSRDRLRESEARLAGILAAAPVGIAVLEEGRILWANERLAALTGRGVEGLAGTPAEELLRGRHGQPTGLAALLGASEPSTASAELQLVPAAGRHLEVLVHVARMPGNPSTHTLSILDVTEHARLERQLRQSQKMEALGQVLGSVAHDFGNLLQALQISTEELHAIYAAGRSPAKFLGMMDATIEQGRRLIHQLLAFSRRQPSAPGPLDLGQLVRQSAPMLQTLAGREILLGTTVTDGLPLVHADLGQVEQVLVNLVINARDALLAREAGPRDLKVAVGPSDPARGEAEGGVVLEVEDNGTGMSEEVRARIFEPFFTTKPEGKGSGLGLATVYGIVQSHGASLALTTEPGRGTTFRIVWPSERPSRA
jgi:PAS domain S-box-containing protein